jgi:hypothetical protein
MPRCAGSARTAGRGAAPAPSRPLPRLPWAPATPWSGVSLLSKRKAL